MDSSKQLRGIELRYVLTMYLAAYGRATVVELLEALASDGFDVAGRASKSVSDALRWEMRYGRVRRIARGRYGPGSMPRSTEYRIHKRVQALRRSGALCNLPASERQLPEQPAHFG
jgi:hypothetical protein